MGFSSQNKMKIEGGMSSMTDLVFLLLIFFIIMSLMSNEHKRIDVPEDSPNKLPQPQTEMATVVITEQNLYYVLPGGNPESAKIWEDVAPEIEAAVAASGDLKLKIKGHRKAKYSAVFKGMALAQKNGWDPIISNLK